MPCLVALLAMFFPRIVIVLLVLLSDYMGRAYDTILWPLLGFIFLPYTTLAYAWAVNTNESVTGIFLIVVIIAVLADLGALSGGGTTYHRRRTVVVAR